MILSQDDNAVFAKVLQGNHRCIHAKAGDDNSQRENNAKHLQDLLTMAHWPNPIVHATDQFVNNLAQCIESLHQFVLHVRLFVSHVGHQMGEIRLLVRNSIIV